jgi:hypothetical protein
MPAPRLPFTSVITICTISGKSASVTTKFLLYVCLNIYTNAHTTPSKIDARQQIKKLPVEMLETIESDVP